MVNENGLLEIHVLGALNIEAQGRCLTPKGAKNQALLVLLALSSDMTRPRRWIEDKLWSTFGPEQASANLRQALSKIRASLGTYADILVADRASVSLDASRVWVDLHDGEMPLDERSELLQGLDVRDPEFEDWLRAERAELQSKIARFAPQDARGILIHCRAITDSDTGHERLAADVMANRIGEGVSEQVRAWRQSQDDDAPDLTATDIQVDCQLIAEGNGHAVFVKALHKPSARILYSKLTKVGDLSGVLDCDETMGRTIFEATDQIMGKLPQVLDNARPEARATALSRLGMYRMFSFEQDSLREAYGLMKQAHERDNNGVYLAWTSLIRSIQIMERAETNVEALLDEATELQHLAMEQSEGNPLVNAIVAKMRGSIFRDPAGCLELAELAVEANPASAYAWVSLAEANMIAGRPEDALAMSARARSIARTSPFKHWWDTGHCVIAIACNRPAEAIEAGEAAARAAPLSRPAHRHLLALYALEGQLDKAQKVADKMAKIEPGFSLDRLVNDDNYPVRTLRKKGLLEPIRALL
ncbi:hypothetical protein [Tropicibacter naphthalenivorans]|uniref:DNA-binding transcriptional activator of the SARP family protein n=1 Tax=Tropicibacter naphthalenivorans TaxID=441103 RepID=A0A0P1GB71_9RHOB|nr:hypothetical protein [Tropicibacter naphthalenivorans]CUH78598.1 DNA-binding transcriptional activator of the SARP family protein [Tropicibacter naphthalenivorans]SMC81005.1 hypothetical protein SAMN04488093_104223 [Tropicibacter naphthalenivorans]